MKCVRGMGVVNDSLLTLVLSCVWLFESFGFENCLSAGMWLGGGSMSLYHCQPRPNGRGSELGKGLPRW